MRGVVDDWPQLTQTFPLKLRLALLARQGCGCCLILPRRA
jgi:hypothetical protein